MKQFLLFCTLMLVLAFNMQASPPILPDARIVKAEAIVAPVATTYVSVYAFLQDLPTDYVPDILPSIAAIPSPTHLAIGCPPVCILSKRPQARNRFIAHNNLPAYSALISTKARIRDRG